MIPMTRSCPSDPFAVMLNFLARSYSACKPFLHCRQVLSVRLPLNIVQVRRDAINALHMSGDHLTQMHRWSPLLVVRICGLRRNPPFHVAVRGCKVLRGPEAQP
jgi:hypothetical protein